MHVSVFVFLLVSSPSSLKSFKDGLTKYTKYSGWKELSSLSYGEPHNSCSIVSSIEFDKDAQFFAVAGVTKKIKVMCLNLCIQYLCNGSSCTFLGVQL